MGLTTAERQGFDARLAQIRLIDSTTLIPRSKSAAASIQNVGIGGVIRLGGKTYRVVNTATYREMDDKFQKERSFVATELTLFCLENGETRYLEWSIDDALEISLTENKLSPGVLRGLRYEDDDEVVALEDIDDIVEEEDALVLNGIWYPSADDWSAKFTAADGRISYVFIAEFGDDKTGWLTIESWSEDGMEDGSWEYEAFLSSTIQPAAIEVLCTGTTVQA